MAAAVVASPATMYPPSNGPPPYSASSWPAPPPPRPMPSILSGPDSRRPSETEKDSAGPSPSAPLPPRDMLPSIHEAFSTGPKPNPYASPISTSLPPPPPPPSLPPPHSIPYSQPPSSQPSLQTQPLPPAVSRPYPPNESPSYQQPPPPPPSLSRQPSPPRALQPEPSRFAPPPPSRPPPPAFEHPRLPSVSSIQSSLPPPHSYAPPRYEGSRYEEPRAPERMSVSSEYSHHAPPPPPPPPPPAPQQQPQPQYSYTPAPNPMAHPVVPPTSYSQQRYPPREDRRQSGEAWPEARDEKKMASQPFKLSLKRNLDVWDFENNLAQINRASSTLQEWSKHYNAIAQEQQRSHSTIPDRMPTLESCNEMLELQEKIGHALERMREMIYQQEHAIADQRMREQGGKDPADYDSEMNVYGDDIKIHPFPGSDGKKRRGRAAPPGRCHSCNRAETPEWRRGPDGARTLCNACGLHYAKLTRKNTMKQAQGPNGSSLRPKSMDASPPRQL
ncbi:hypothetical protein F5884DRAFT_525743 [Xylogone sp. PMI_703]|nr:hypothetical protein F5884DRAFT_525743 [Xylogone sp. PMI_703]